MERINLIAAYKVANENSRDVLRKLYPEVDFEGELKAEQRAKIPVRERIKTFEDARYDLGEDHPLVFTYQGFMSVATNEEFMIESFGYDVVSYLKLRIICAALNEGWEPDFTEHEMVCYPRFVFCPSAEMAGKSRDKYTHFINTVNNSGDIECFGVYCDGAYRVHSNNSAYIGSRLAFKNDTLAIYAGCRFINLYADLYILKERIIHI